jgi:2-oxoglutarate dehydrogenase complex dehydrogenase (E1) component-like enzyme
VIEAEQWEKFLARKYVGTKRFGLDGGESMVPRSRRSSNMAASSAST